MSDYIGKIARFISSEERGHAVPPELVYLLLVLGVIIFIWDLFDRHSKRINRDSGIDEKAEIIALKGSSQIPTKEYSSTSLGLSSRPDALLKIDGFIIPVDRKPLSRKVRDRHIVQLLVHMRLIEETDGLRPPYGILLLGPEVRTIRVKNTPERQRWLETLIDEIHSIINGIPARPSPTPMKCKSCDVRAACEFSAYKPKLKTLE